MKHVHIHLDMIHKVFAKVAAFTGKYAGKFLYYGCVAAALCAIAVAAESFRSDGDHYSETLILPAAELGVSAPEVDKNRLTAPEGAVVLRGFAQSPEWNKRLGQWECHEGVDYVLADGLVKSLCDGVVRTVGKSGVYGGFIEVEAGQYLLRYASVDADKDVVPGYAVTAGDVIAAADDSMPGEAYMEPHLHLELFKMNKSIDFESEAGKNTLTGN